MPFGEEQNLINDMFHFKVEKYNKHIITTVVVDIVNVTNICPASLRLLSQFFVSIYRKKKHLSIGSH